MKKWLLISFLIVLSASKIAAQNYFPKGATWHYNNIIYSFPVNYNYTTLTSKGDTIFNGDTLTYLEGYVGCGTGQNELIKQVGQKVYKLNKCDSTYSLLYDFNVNVGDTITTFPDICFALDSIEIKIDSIHPININGNILNQFYFTQLYPPNQFAASYNGVGSFIEGIGNTDSFYPYINTCDPWSGPLRCYDDSILGYYNAGLYTNCDTVFSVGVEEYNLADNIKLFPNPTKGLIQIETDLTIEKIEVYSLESKKLLETHSLQIDITNLHIGFYILKLYSEKGIIYRKILKE